MFTSFIHILQVLFMFYGFKGFITPLKITTCRKWNKKPCLQWWLLQYIGNDVRYVWHSLLWHVLLLQLKQLILYLISIFGPFFSISITFIDQKSLKNFMQYLEYNKSLTLVKLSLYTSPSQRLCDNNPKQHHWLSKHAITKENKEISFV